MSGAQTKPAELGSRRRRGRHSCWEIPHQRSVVVAYDADLGTLLRTCQQRSAGRRIVAVELAEGATSLPRLTPARGSTVLLLGHEHHGVPDEVLADIDECVEIPMVGWGASLNVAVPGSLVAYRLAGCRDPRPLGRPGADYPSPCVSCRRNLRWTRRSPLPQTSGSIIASSGGSTWGSSFVACATGARGPGRTWRRSSG
jgi:hypothetical protein